MPPAYRLCCRCFNEPAILECGIQRSSLPQPHPQLLLSFESIIPLRRPSEFRDPKVHHRILGLTEGVLVRICRLVETAATEAIRGGHEQISLALLKDDLVAESLVSIVDRRSRRVASR